MGIWGFGTSNCGTRVGTVYEYEVLEPKGLRMYKLSEVLGLGFRDRALSILGFEFRLEVGALNLGSTVRSWGLRRLGSEVRA